MKFVILGMTTEEAFELLITKKQWYKKCSIERNMAYTYVSRFKKKELSKSKMEDILERAGWSKVPEMWFQSTK